MTRPNHRRWTLVVAASVAAHAGVLALLALNAPNLNMRAVPPDVFEVTVVPRYLPREKLREERRETVQARPLIPRRVLRPDEPLPVAPLITPNAPAAARPADQGSAFHPAPNPPGPKDQLRNALRSGAPGCANADSVILNKAERENCLERLGKGAKDAPFIEPPMSRDKRRAFDEAAAKKKAYRDYKEGNLPPGVTQKDGGPQMRELPPIWPPPR
jgi:hypothetical protein